MLWMIWLLVLAAVFSLYFLRLFSRFSKYGVKNFMPFPIVGNRLDMLLKRNHIVEMFERVYYGFPHDRFVGYFEFFQPVVILRDLDLIKKITLKDFEHFIDHRSLIDEKVDPLFGRNLFSLKGDEWKDMRSTLSPAFTSSKIRLMVPFMVEVGDQMLQALQDDMKKSGLKYVDVETKDLATRFANDVIASCAFGLKVNSHKDMENEFYMSGKKTTNFSIFTLMKIMLGTSSPLIRKIIKTNFISDETKLFFRTLVMGTMKDREKNNIIRPDMIHLLMEAKKGKLIHEKATKDADAGFSTVEESNVGKKSVNRVWSDDDLTAQAVLFFIAGFDTVSTAMSFVLYELAVNTKIQERLYEEIKNNEAKNDYKFDYNSVQNMTYLDMVVSEALRLWPPVVALDRICVKKYNMGKASASCTEDFYINEGEAINIPVLPIQRDPQYFPDPLRFDPERFSEENKHKINPWTYGPFGMGPRNCIGSRFALCELKVMVYQLLLKMELIPSDKTCIPPVLDGSAVNLRLKGGTWVRMVPRTN